MYACMHAFISTRTLSVIGNTLSETISQRNVILFKEISCCYRRDDEYYDEDAIFDFDGKSKV